MAEPTQSTAPAPRATPSRALTREQRFARKLERANDLDYLLIWTRTPDSQVLRSFLYAIDRGCQKIRATAASLLLPLAVAKDTLEQVQSWLDQLEGLTISSQSTVSGPSVSGLAAEQPLSPRDKQALRDWRRAIAGQYGVDFYLPRSPEGRRLALAISALDGLLIHARSTESLDQAGPTLERIGQLIRDGHALAEKLAQMANLDYTPHPLLKRALKRITPSSSLVASIVADAEAAGRSAAHEPLK